MQNWWLVPHYNLFVFSDVQETDGLWRIMADYQKHNQVVSHVVVAVSMWFLLT